MKILVAEDDAVSRLLLETHLKKWGHAPVTTTDGAAAWEMLQRDDAPALAILDWMMPGLDGVEVCRRARGRTDPRPLYVILLTARADPQDTVDGLGAGADDFVTKPFAAAELRARVSVGVRVVELQVELAARVADLERALARVDQLHGLLPMDGFEVTAAIRAFEKETGGHLPISAVTASALKGDREACLAAGMDGYLSKPIRVAELLAVIDRLAGGADPSFDLADALARVEGNRELLAELVDIFHTERPRLLANLRHSVEIGDARGVEEAAHAIRGTVGCFGARAASEAARALEVMGQKGLLAGAGAGVVRLEHEVDHLERDLVRMGEQAPA